MALDSKRAVGDSKSRLIEAAEHLMRDEGYAAVTSRRVASGAGLKPQLVHYYFRTMDDLYLAVLQRGTERNDHRLSQALASAQPLKALWEHCLNPEAASMSTEFLALANHRKTIRAQIARYVEHYRAAEIDALTRLLKEQGIGRDVCTPAALAIAMDGIALALIGDRSVGLSRGHDETIALVQRYLKLLGGSRSSRRPAKDRKQVIEHPRVSR